MRSIMRIPNVRPGLTHVRAAALSALMACLSFGGSPTLTAAQAQSPTGTPIKHLVVIFQENVSFDHYFATYPNALNPPGEPPFQAAPGTPAVHGLTGPLLTNNPNLANPQRLSRAQAATCDQDHGYTHEQQAYDRGGMDMFVQFTGKSLTLQQCLTDEGNPAPAGGTNPNYAVLDYYDGNTVTALWNYAQRFAMSDNSYGTTFGPSTPGALNLIAGQTHGATPATIPNSVANGTVIGDPDPTFDACSKGTTIAMSGQNVGDLLNAQNITWGWFQGGFAPSSTTG